MIEKSSQGQVQFWTAPGSFFSLDSFPFSLERRERKTVWKRIYEKDIAYSALAAAMMFSIFIFCVKIIAKM